MLNTIKTIPEIKHSNLVTQVSSGDSLLLKKKLFRAITDRPSSGTDPLIVSTGGLSLNSVDNDAIIQRPIGAIGTIEVLDNPVGVNGTVDVTVGGVPINSVSVSYISTDSASTVATALAVSVDVLGYSAFAVANVVYVTGTPTDGGNTLDLTLVIGSLFNYATAGLSEGGYYNHQINYDFPNDSIIYEYDSAGNIFVPGGIATSFLNIADHSSTAAYNNFREDGGSDFSHFGGIMSYNNHYNSSSIDVRDSNVTYNFNNLFSGASLDLTGIVNREKVEKCNIYGVAMTFIKQVENLYISPEESNYENDYTLTPTSTIDYDITPDFNFTGIVTLQTSTALKTVSNLQFAPKRFRIKVLSGQTVTVQHGTGNIFLDGAVNVTLVGTNGDFLELIHDGTNCYQYVASTF